MTRMLLRKAAPLALLAVPTIVVAVSAPPTTVPTTGVPTTAGAFYTFLCAISNWIFAFIIVVAVIMLLYGAFKFFTAGGNEDQVATARKFITYALVGVAVAILARALILVVANLLSGTTISLFGTGC